MNKQHHGVWLVFRPHNLSNLSRLSRRKACLTPFLVSSGAASRHRAFTLVELLVVIAIIAVMVAMTLPAINASRESARRAECMTRLSLIGAAAQEYESAYEFYPPGVEHATGPIESTEAGSYPAWTGRLLPYLDEKNIYRTIDFSVGTYDAKNAAARATLPRVFVCPSAPDAELFPQSSYAACQNDVEAPINVDNHGMFFLNSHLRASDVSDGLSCTIFFGEKLLDPKDLGWLSGTRATHRNTGWPLNDLLVPEVVVVPAAPSDAPGAPDADKAEAPDPFGEGPAESPAETKPVEPPPPPRPPKPPITPLTVGGFGGYHPTVVLFTFGDGSVRAISDTIDMEVLRQLANRADGKLFLENQLPW